MIVHEVMGRDCGWLTAATAKAYRDSLTKRQLLPQIGKCTVVGVVSVVTRCRLTKRQLLPQVGGE